jgi:glycosyltransferase involved in cell wall biosynthesis
MEKDLISVIVPVYNAREWLPYCLDSILAQTWDAWEAVLVDDGSTDGSGSICDHYAGKDRRFRVIHQKNNGVASARNVAVSAANGRYFYFIDADDSMHPRALEYLYSAICNSPYLMASADFVETSGLSCWCEDPVPCEIQFRILDGDDTMWGCVEGYGFVWHVIWNKLIDRTLLGEKPFDPIAQEDRFLMFRILLEIGKFIHLDCPLYAYLDRPASLSKESYYLSMDSNKMIWDHMLQYTSGNERCHDRILGKVYRRILTLRFNARDKAGRKAVVNNYGPFVREHLHEYLASKEIPVRERVAFPFLYTCPWAVWAMMKLKGN